MKKLALFLLTISLAISCNPKEELTKEEKIQKSIEAKLKPLMKDSASYEFVSMSISRTFSVSERREVINQNKLEEVEALDKKLPSPALVKQVETELSFLQEQRDETKEATYYVDFTAKGSNSFGGVVTSTYSATVINDEKLTVVGLKKK
ncbi:MAG: hypothetical protein AAF090_18450 [Bacteroidota bacterium]